MNSPAGESCFHCFLPVPPGRRGGSGPWFCCFGCRFASELSRPAAQEGKESAPLPANTLLLRLGLGIFLTLNIMVASWLSYAQEIFGDGALPRGADGALTAVFGYLALFLCTLVLVLLGLPLLVDSLRALGPAAGGRRLHAQWLIVLGVFSAFILSVVHTLKGEGSVYFDTAAMVLVIVTLGSYLEAGARRRAATSASRLLAALPQTAWILKDDSASNEAPSRFEEVPGDDLEVGQIVRVRPGETVPVDGTVVAGASQIGEASLTGESRPRPVEVGDYLLAGSSSLDGQILVEAKTVGKDTVLALMERSLAEARGKRPGIQRLADRVSAVFVPAVVLLALSVFMLWAYRGNPEKGVLTALSVLLISCPCALGLAAPLACWYGLRRAAEQGILIDSPATLERAAAVDRVFFDKTGTLSSPVLDLQELALAPGVVREQAMSWAMSLESASLHPIARALCSQQLTGCPPPVVPEDARTISGRGVEGRVEGRLLRFGGCRWARKLGLGRDPLFATETDHDTSHLFLMDEEKILARYRLMEVARPDAVETLNRLRRRSLAVEILSGDGQRPTARFAGLLGVKAEGELLPQEKVRRLEEARRGSPLSGALAMVGDGINDAPVLAAADVGIALGSASDLARRSGHVRLTSDRLDRLPILLDLARDVRRRIRWNLAFAFGFNTLGVLMAAVGWLSPIFAAAAMVSSSLLVVRISRGAGQGIGRPSNAQETTERPPARAGSEDSAPPQEAPSPSELSYPRGGG